MRQKREEKKKATSPFELVTEEYETKYQVPLKIKRLDNFDEKFDIRIGEDVVEVHIPRFEGPRARLWDSIVLSALLYLNKEDVGTKGFINELFKLYEINEGRRRG